METIEVEEGDPCPIEGCNGKLYFPSAKDCTCHISPPCGSCLDVVLTCDECGWQDDGEEHETR